MSTNHQSADNAGLIWEEPPTATGRPRSAGSSRASASLR